MIKEMLQRAFGPPQNGVSADEAFGFMQRRMDDIEADKTISDEDMGHIFLDKQVQMLALSKRYQQKIVEENKKRGKFRWW